MVTETVSEVGSELEKIIEKNKISEVGNDKHVTCQSELHNSISKGMHVHWQKKVIYATRSEPTAVSQGVSDGKDTEISSVSKTVL